MILPLPSITVRLFVARFTTEVASNLLLRLVSSTLVVLPCIVALCRLLTLILVTPIIIVIIRGSLLIVCWLIALFLGILIRIIIPIRCVASILVLVGVV